MNKINRENQKNDNIEVSAFDEEDPKPAAEDSKRASFRFSLQERGEINSLHRGSLTRTVNTQSM